jgi:hypothetical protein
MHLHVAGDLMTVEVIRGWYANGGLHLILVEDNGLGTSTYAYRVMPDGPRRLAVSRPDDLVGYAYRADLYCPRCILHVLTGRDPVGIGGPPLTVHRRPRRTAGQTRPDAMESIPVPLSIHGCLNQRHLSYL